MWLLGFRKLNIFKSQSIKRYFDFKNVFTKTAESYYFLHIAAINCKLQMSEMLGHMIYSIFMLNVTPRWLTKGFKSQISIPLTVIITSDWFMIYDTSPLLYFLPFKSGHPWHGDFATICVCFYMVSQIFKFQRTMLYVFCHHKSDANMRLHGIQRHNFWLNYNFKMFMNLRK